MHNFADFFRVVFVFMTNLMFGIFFPLVESNTHPSFDAAYVATGSAYSAVYHIILIERVIRRFWQILVYLCGNSETLCRSWRMYTGLFFLIVIHV